MLRIKRIGKMIGLSIVGLVAFSLMAGFVFVKASPEFGGPFTDERMKRYELSGNYMDGKFTNLIPTSMDMGLKNMVTVIADFIKGSPGRQPDFEIPIENLDSLEIVNNTEQLTRLTWFGHSTFLLEIDGMNILLDPMLGDSPSPIPALGTKRYSKNLPIEIEKLPAIDAVIISHDHYDHLDYGSIRELSRKVNTFYVPLGVGAHLEGWGIPKESIHELDWWEEISHKSLTLVFTPARHFSGRGLFDRFTTLWGSWVIKGQNDNIFFSGDSGYGPHFKEIGEKYGPFDFAMIECGQYDERWGQIHMMPEESVQAALDVKTKLMMPIHWGAFTLALHSWTDPVERSIAEARKLKMSVTTPKIGEPIILDTMNKPNEKWWK